MGRVTKENIMDIVANKNGSHDDDAYDITLLLSKWVTAFPHGWQLLGFDGFVTRDICRLCHYHEDRHRWYIVGYPGEMECRCEVPEAIMALVQLECFEKGSRLVYHERQSNRSP